MLLAFPYTWGTCRTGVLGSVDLWPPRSRERAVVARGGGRSPARSLGGVCAPRVTAVFSAPVSTGAVHFLRSLLEPDPVKRPNIQQALANRWLNENYVGKVPCNVTYPNR